jgi:hypothetical protein
MYVRTGGVKRRVIEEGHVAFTASPLQQETRLASFVDRDSEQHRPAAEIAAARP